MNVAFKTELRNMTYEHYLKQPKLMIEWVLKKKISKKSRAYKKHQETHLIH